MKRLPPPETEDAKTHVLEALSQMDNFRVKGPMVKLMRWFSWFESAVLYAPELHGLKMALHYMIAGLAPMPADNADDNAADNAADAEAAGNAELHPPTEDAAQVLRDLKKAKGTLRVAYDCITVENRWAMHLLLVLVRPLWSRYAKNIKENRTSADVLFHHVCMARGMWKEELAQIVQSVHSAKAMDQLGLHRHAEDAQEMQAQQDAADSVIDSMMHMLHYRAKSETCKPHGLWVLMLGVGALHWYPKVGFELVLLRIASARLCTCGFGS